MLKIRIKGIYGYILHGLEMEPGLAFYIKVTSIAVLFQNYRFSDLIWIETCKFIQKVISWWLQFCYKSCSAQKMLSYLQMFPTVEIIHVPPFSQWWKGHPAAKKCKKVILNMMLVRLGSKNAWCGRASLTQTQFQKIFTREKYLQSSSFKLRVFPNCFEVFGKLEFPDFHFI